ncbi:hypothetical protein HY500_03840 [Candidatus Woesearchaeota archaeon]|nr:hypothetical protein [Candidatus Woesearchaeota archaeon]
MNPDSQTLERLSYLNLMEYSGDLFAIRGEDRQLYSKLMESPVEMIVTAQPEVCVEEIYRICSGAVGGYRRFIDLRQRIMRELAAKFETPGWCLLSVLFNGIFVGEPEDLLNHRNGNPSRVLYPTKGLGAKIAELSFLNYYRKA